jgi:cobalt/nickel transport system ATP-binding protein
MSHHITEFDNLSFTYPGGNKALDGFSATIRHGESVGVIGANGAGKSTLLLLLTGILTPGSGEVRIGGVKITKKTLASMQSHMGLVFQDPNHQLFMGSVYDDVAFGPRNMGLTEEEVDSRVKEALMTVGIPHLMDKAPFRLSEGEKRAASIATVISMRPDILIMDEPTSSLDPRARRGVIGLLQKFEHTKIITSHDLDMVLEVTNRVIVMKDGRLAADGETAKILSDEALLVENGLELPLSLQNCPVCRSRKKYTLIKPG